MLSHVELVGSTDECEDSMRYNIGVLHDALCCGQPDYTDELDVPAWVRHARAVDMSGAVHTFAEKHILGCVDRCALRLLGAYDVVEAVRLRSFAAARAATRAAGARPRVAELAACCVDGSDCEYALFYVGSPADVARACNLGFEHAQHMHVSGGVFLSSHPCAIAASRNPTQWLGHAAASGDASLHALLCRAALGHVRRCGARSMSDVRPDEDAFYPARDPLCASCADGDTPCAEHGPFDHDVVRVCNISALLPWRLAHFEADGKELATSPLTEYLVRNASAIDRTWGGANGVSLREVADLYARSFPGSRLLRRVQRALAPPAVPSEARAGARGAELHGEAWPLAARSSEEPAPAPLPSAAQYAATWPPPLGVDADVPPDHAPTARSPWWSAMLRPEPTLPPASDALLSTLSAMIGNLSHDGTPLHDGTPRPPSHVTSYVYLSLRTEEDVPADLGARLAPRPHSPDPAPEHWWERAHTAAARDARDGPGHGFGVVPWRAADAEHRPRARPRAHSPDPPERARADDAPWRAAEGLVNARCNDEVRAIWADMVDELRTAWAQRLLVHFEVTVADVAKNLRASASQSDLCIVKYTKKRRSCFSFQYATKNLSYPTMSHEREVVCGIFCAIVNKVLNEGADDDAKLGRYVHFRAGEWGLRDLALADVRLADIDTKRDVYVLLMETCDELLDGSGGMRMIQIGRKRARP